MPLSSRPVFPLSAKDSCKQALVRRWSVAGSFGLLWFFSSCLQPDIPAAVQLCLCVSATSRRSRVICARAPQTWMPQADSKPHPDLCEREPAKRRQLEHAPDKISRAVCSQWPSPSEFLQITCDSNAYVVLLLKNSAWFWCLSSSSSLVFGLRVLPG